jgi:ATP-dependent DNA helicase RecG
VAAVKEKPKKEDGLGRLSRLGFSKISECLLVVPKEYRDCTRAIQSVNRSMIGKSFYFVLEVRSIAMFDKFKNITRTWKDVIRVQVMAVDSKNQSVKITVFGAVWPWLKKQPGELIHAYGMLDEWEGFIQLNNPVMIEEEDRGRIIPIYKGKVGQVSSDLVNEGVRQALPLVDDSACNLLAKLGMREAEFTKETGLSCATELLGSIHTPGSVAEGSKAVELAKKLTAMAIVRRAESNQIRTPIAASSIAVNRKYVEELIGRLPYPLTSDQWDSVQKIVNDLRAPYPMNRLLSGDVGTGKTLTFMLPAVAAYKAGATVAIIVPSQLLVSQHARELKHFFPEVEVSEVIAGSKLESGIAIGTTALISVANKKKVVFDFVIIDEQHKFSVSQKSMLIKKHTNFLEATATVIPRTLAIVNYGGMDLSVLRVCPVKKTIDSRIVEHYERQRMFTFVEKVFETNTQVAVILPLVEDQAETVVEGRLQSVGEAQREWAEKFPHRRIAVLTGQMEASEKESVIQRMHRKEIDLLISTVVIETGVTLPSLRALIVIHPERFGASQLHQLRGRVARKGGKGYFMMFCPTELEAEALERLNLLTRYADGFDIAEADMELRGFGDIENDSESQTGSTSLLFWGVQLSKEDIEVAAKNSKLELA